MIARGAVVAAAVSLVVLACGNVTWSFDGDGGAGVGADASSPAKCTVDTDCTSATLHCDPASGQCVPCVNDSQCTQAGLRRCDTTLNQCVQCGLTSDCGSGQVCEPTSHTCVSACDDAGACPQGTQCDQARGVCVGCLGDGDCATSSTGQFCDTGNGQCVQCVHDSQCVSPRRRCNPADDKCVQCLSGADCDDHVCNLATYTCADDSDS